MERAEAEVQALGPGIVGLAPGQPLPVAAVAGPVGVLAQGALQTKDDVERALLATARRALTAKPRMRPTLPGQTGTGCQCRRGGRPGPGAVGARRLPG